MNFLEHAAKPLLAEAGIPVPLSRLATSAAQAASAADELGPVVIKAQVPTGKRGKAGGIKPASTGDEAQRMAAQILGMEIAGHTVESVLVEAQADIRKEFYAAVLNDPDRQGPLVMFSPMGGMDIEEVAATQPQAVCQLAIDIREGFDVAAANELIAEMGLGDQQAGVAETLARLYQAYNDNDAELIEINPLAVLGDGSLVALDCKFTLDDSAIKRREALAGNGCPEKTTGLEEKGQNLGLKYIDLDGTIGVLANGAGLTMTTMDVISHHGGAPANFLEIGGEAYTKATPALELVLSNPRVKCIVVNFCGAFARTDVMTEGILNAMDALSPQVPFFFTVHGTGAAEARAMLHERLGITPYPTMDDAIIAAVKFTKGEQA
jgi:succinyl-CoA synthetase beta subunit